ncbi:folylpolyglutamate synthase/dihydrofolate synthase family protein [Peptoniphilus sp. oral taxon 386]|uniref:bifunctional folylpolyglutamate synthase/dihydrofolate synthase n=1 Tax=Peptoniphilus sp. oral taxon 386 TaxID=652713 RepID=UPI0001DAA419|nr:folylpolyglutamate synthase/dihydrofolate synthase family protein [Peptoniphilus sp. oral taxon 386]EFI41319.1 bifunctional protein FolC [Peptoniphilus sp. oral taxon 386 str. F0131]
MKFSDVILNIESREGKRKSYDFSRMRALLKVLNNPHDGLKYLHVAGTNGKGSTSNFLYNILISEGYIVGLYTSPHLERYNERIMINGNEISDEDFTRLGKIVIDAEKQILDEFEVMTYFEFITAMAFLYFREKNCDYCVLEVGMGGLSDSTNVVAPKDKLMSFITPISMDHMQYLGNTVEEIAEQKAGIIVKNVDVVSSNKNKSVVEILKNKAERENAQYYDLDDVKIENLIIDDRGSEYTIKFKDETISNLKINLSGYYQLENSALTVMGVMQLRNKGLLKISDESIRNGLKNTFWAGRMERVNDSPMIILDGAHNFDGIQRLTENFRLFNYNKLYIITSILNDKEHDKMLLEFSKYADEIVLVSLETKRKTELDILREEAQKYCENVKVIDNLKLAIKDVINVSKRNDLIVIAGSLYLVSDTRKIIKEILKIN